jgi:hypothetical protein
MPFLDGGQWRRRQLIHFLRANAYRRYIKQSSES